jgi:hypothetical protein
MSKMARNLRRCLPIPMLLAMVAIAAAQPQMPPMNPLDRLDYALQQAGAPALSAAQQTSITALIATFRAAHQSGPAGDTVVSLQTAYENAIFDGNRSDAAVHAAALANAHAAVMAKIQADAATLAIDIIGVLKTERNQAGILMAQLGKTRFVRLLLSLTGGPGGFGPGRGPRGDGPGTGTRGRAPARFGPPR